jgi:hypothetical protein
LQSEAMMEDLMIESEKGNGAALRLQAPQRLD